MNFEQELLSIEKTNPDKARELRRWLESFFWYVHKENSGIERSYPDVKRGRILLVNFGYGVHSEFRYNHYAVALHSSPRKSGKVTVIPLTSKKHPYLIPIGHELGDCLDALIFEKERSVFWRPYRALADKVLEETGLSFGFPAMGSYNTVYSNCTAFLTKIKESISGSSSLHKDIDKILSELKAFDKFVNDSPNLLKSSYLRPEDITTISKARIILPKRVSHPLYNLRLSDATLNKLDDEIIRLYTGK